jgi:PKD repeat protein
VFFSGSSPDSHMFDPATHTWTLNVARTRYGADRRYGSSVLLPLRPEEGYRARVMILGGNNPATASAEIIDLSGPAPAWRSLPPMSAPRIEGNAVLLPTGQLLALGGSAVDNDASTASLDADLFDPVTEMWSPAGRSAVPRLYHSVALLLPDATVWVAGSNPFQGWWDNRMEIYSPAYLFTTDASGRAIPAARPSISSVPGRVGYDAPFTVDTPNAADIASVVLIRPGSNTHAFDFEQRLVGLSYTREARSLTVMSPPDANVAPPGYYMLFLVNANGVPSVARFIQLAPNPANQPPRGAILTPAADVTIKAGQTVTFSGDASDPDGGVARYSWVFPGGRPATSTSAAPGAVTFSTPGTYVVSLTVTDEHGDNDPSPPTHTVTVQPPSFGALITGPPGGATVNGTQTVALSVGGGTGPFTYALRVDGTQVFTTTQAATSTTYAWNTATVPDGPHTLGLTVTDATGQQATTSITVSVANASGAITVSLTTPRPGEVVSGTVWVNVWAGDTAGPFSYTLTVAGATVWTESSSRAHVTLPWNTTKTPNGAQTVTATVQSSTRTGSASVTVSVQNGGGAGPAPLAAGFGSPAQGAAVTGTTAIGMTASGGSAAYTYVLELNGTPLFTTTTSATSASYAWDTRTVPSGAHTLRLSLTDRVGRRATASRVVTVNNGGSTGTLVVALTSPRPGETVRAWGWANIWVDSPGAPPFTYGLSMGGTVLWQESSSQAHVTLPWDTTRVPEGPATLTATVRDAAGRSGSARVDVVVQNP